jgi:hypothetical protein
MIEFLSGGKAANNKFALIGSRRNSDVAVSALKKSSQKYLGETPCVARKTNKRKSEPGASLRGQGTPAYPARLRSERARNSSEENSSLHFANLLFFVAAQEFIALDGGNYADGAFIARLGALDAAEAAYADGSCQGDLVRQGQKNFNR